MALLYFLISIAATAVGSLTGLGGGIIIKPILDLLGHYTVETIGVLSSITVLCMAVVSIGKHVLAKNRLPFGTAVPLAAGSAAGGIAGQWLLERIIALSGAGGRVTVVQNAVLIVLILGVFLYMLNKQKIEGRRLSGAGVSIAVGLFLGACSSFLGIGGGPINVALIIYLYGYGTKTATLCSLVTILFAQLSKLGTAALTAGLASFELEIAPAMVAGAVAGGFIGATLNKKCTERTIEIAFNCIQVFVMLVAIVNLVRNIGLA